MEKSIMRKENHVSIVADSGCDMLPEEADRFGVHLLPMKIRFGNEEFDDGITITRDEFYSRLIESDVLPKTSQISPFAYSEAFQEEIEKGNEVVCLTLSSKISGSFQSANIAAADFDGKVHVVDTLHFCGSEYLLVQRAAQMRDQGLTAVEIAASIEVERNQVQIIALFDTLHYAQMGGRVSAVAANLGNLLSIKPVLTIADGEVSIIGKARGSRNGTNHLMRFVKEHGGIDWNRPILLSYSGQSDLLLEKYITDSASLYEGRAASDLPRSRVGATIGTYTGPGCIAFSFFPMKNGKQ